MLVTAIFALSRRHRWQTEAERGAADPAGSGLHPDTRGGFGLKRAPRALRPASEHRPAGTEPEIRLPGQEGTRGRTRTRKNAAVERRRARALPYWAHDAPAS